MQSVVDSKLPNTFLVPYDASLSIILYYSHLSNGFFPHVEFCMGFSPGLYRVSADLNQLSCDSSLAPGFVELLH